MRMPVPDSDGTQTNGSEFPVVHRMAGHQVRRARLDLPFNRVLGSVQT